MRRVNVEIGLSESAFDSFGQLFLVFYLTRGDIFVNRLGLPAKSQNLQAAVNWPEQTPE